MRKIRLTRLQPGEAREVRFRLPKKDLGFYDNEGKYRLESGLFRVFVGGSSRDVLEQELRVTFA